MNPVIIKLSEPVYDSTLYLDKDGVLNTALYRKNKLSSPRKSSEINIKKDLHDIVKFSDKKFNLIVISNQPDLRRGLITPEFLLENLKQINTKIPLSLAFFCPHIQDDQCDCRKPKTGLILAYRKLYPNCCKKELFIGDQPTDAMCAQSLNIPFIKVWKPTSLLNNISNSLSVETE